MAALLQFLTSSSTCLAPLKWLILSALFANVAFSGQIVKHLPGFHGELPFKLETGYVSVGDSELFYYFIESQGDPEKDPLFLWLTGGPGCSSFGGLIFEIGPLEFDVDNYKVGLPELKYCPYAWTKSASFIFLDAPVGSGFSYARTPEGWHISDSESAEQSYQFLKKWLLEHPQYLLLQLYIGGDSYSGIPVPLITKKVIEGNEASVLPHLNLQGYLVGSPMTDLIIDRNSRIVFAHRLALISDELYENFVYEMAYSWANDPLVQDALHVRKGIVSEWVRCNRSLSYEKNVTSVVDVHRYLSTKGLQLLVETGDHDMTTPYVGTEKWIKSLNLTIADDWRPWYIDGQVAGYTRKNSQHGFQLTFATVKGGGHPAPEFKRRECYEMFQRWIHYYPL
ncbi:serine carboxypeptidase-like 18 isoform X2 [Hevea brasiliensis]|uniref:serine carboxypeptidase-like 18 isoform X2 n=1 Tax=Hevea brasiliensis TaxID=3981 RepID=UPI0025EAA685|nr:serine carboxypeptidase-like 18 isoform X2 [Hevea brasiliensis]